MRQKNIIHVCESLCTDIVALAKNVNINSEMAALYDEKCKQLKGIVDDKLLGSSMLMKLIHLPDIFNIEKQVSKLLI